MGFPSASSHQRLRREGGGRQGRLSQGETRLPSWNTGSTSRASMSIAGRVCALSLFRHPWTACDAQEGTPGAMRAPHL